MHLVDAGTVFTGVVGSPTQTPWFPSVTVLSDGSIIAGFAVGRKKHDPDGTVRLSQSHDGGLTWSMPVEPFSGHFDGQRGTLGTLNITEIESHHLLASMFWWDTSDPTKTFVNPETHGTPTAKILLADSYDSGQTWSKLRELDSSPYCQPSLNAPILLLSNGELACPFATSKGYCQTEPWRHRAVFKFSPDAGRSWPECVIAAHDSDLHIHYWDQRPALLPSGRIIDLFWTHDTKLSKDVNIHCSIGSADGRSWPLVPHNTGVPGQIAHPMALPDGRVAMVYVDRYQTNAIRLCLSKDGGQTWDSDSTAVVYEHRQANAGQKVSEGEYLNSMHMWTFGQPCGAMIGEHAAIVLYYCGNCEATKIAWTHVEF